MCKQIKVLNEALNIMKIEHDSHKTNTLRGWR